MTATTEATPRLTLVGASTASRPEFEVNGAVSGREWARKYRLKLVITDVAMVSAALSVALIARFGFDEASTPLGSFHVDYWVISAIIGATWIASLSATRTRDPRILGMGSTEYKRVVNASAITFGLLAITFLIFQVDIARSFFILAFPVGVTVLTLERWLWRRWLARQRRFGHYLSRVLVVGQRDDVEYVISQLHAHSGIAYCVVGVALDSAEGSSRPTEITVDHRTVPIVTNLENVADTVCVLGVNTVIVAGQPSGGAQYVRSLGWELENTNAELVLSSRLTDVAGPRIHFRPVEGLPLIHVEIPRFDGFKHALKRSLDIAASSLALIVLSPALLVVAALIRADSPGPVLFLQERCGRGGETFRMVKFRSMVVNAEDNLSSLLDQNQASGTLFKIRNDPRITRIGGFLRKHSIDELPQLWNIIRGDMSIVGPRPSLPQEVLTYETHVHRRLYIKPGLTGMWQISGRSDLSWEESVRLDLYYVENWSLTKDLMIIWRTFQVVIHPVGAY
ncbi:sugar transferase [Cryobacterium sp. CG_9.6]|uniref:sugar transferase n=1 Tax=Cryobacterium sp. CG_9.6 TaxID=2760710 RepID=UPI00247484AA|nr:sugar transferase [Cryobacterium sp. CG_9.6]MDH6238266.1 exopolysaccharide biosynthesis polyprenyl glycosylphosphotransferase [Cryobacterium sp. CG_9.6]